MFNRDAQRIATNDPPQMAQRRAEEANGQQPTADSLHISETVEWAINASSATVPSDNDPMMTKRRRRHCLEKTVRKYT